MGIKGTQRFLPFFDVIKISSSVTCMNEGRGLGCPLFLCSALYDLDCFFGLVSQVWSCQW